MWRNFGNTPSDGKEPSREVDPANFHGRVGYMSKLGVTKWQCVGIEAVQDARVYPSSIVLPKGLAERPIAAIGHQ
jgi:hypothetical protein